MIASKRYESVWNTFLKELTRNSTVTLSSFQKSYVMEELYSDVNVVLLAGEIIRPVKGHLPLFNKPIP